MNRAGWTLAAALLLAAPWWIALPAGCRRASDLARPSEQSPDDGLEKTAEKGPLKLVVRLTPRTPRLSDVVELAITATAPADIEIRPPAFGAAVGDFVVRDYSEAPRESSAAGETRCFRYRLEPTHAGRHLIRSIALEFADRRAGSETKGEPVRIEVEPLEVLVTSPFGDGVPSLADLEPMLPPQPLPRSGTAWLGWLALAGVLVAGGLVWLRRHRRAASVSKPPPSPEEIARAALAALLAEDLPARGLVKEFYLRLTNVVRQYIEDTTGLRAPEQTTEEFLREMRVRAVFPAERSVRLQEFLEAADLVKYAGQQPDPGQIERASVRAREFIQLVR